MKKFFKQYFIMLILILVFTPYAIEGELMHGVSKGKEFWFYGVSVAIILSSCLSLLFLKKPKLRLHWPDLLLLIYYSYVVVHIFLTNRDIFYLDKFAILTFSVLLYFCLKPFWISESKNVVDPYFRLFCMGLMLSASGQAVIGILQLNSLLASFNAQFQISGTFTNPAPYSFFLGAIFPFALAIFFRTKSQMKANREISIKDVFLKPLHFVSIVTLLLTLFILPATMIRTGWLMAIAGSAIVLYKEYKPVMLFLWTRRWVKLINLAAGLLIIIAVSMAVYGLKKNSADGRVLIWEITADKVGRSLFFGHGFGSFSSQYTNWQADWFAARPEEKEGPRAMLAGNVKFAYNEFLEIAVETGLVGLGLFSGFLFLVIVTIKKGNPQAEGDLLPLLLALFVGSLFSYPLFSLPTQVLFMLALSISAAGLGGKSEVTFKLGLPFRIAGMVMVFSVSLVFLSTKYKEYLALKEWKVAAYLQQIGNYKEALSVYQKIYPDLKYDGVFLQFYGKCLSLDSQHAASNEILEKAANFSNDIFLYTTLGDNHKALGQLQLAKKSYQQAIDMEPHKFYAPYLMAKLHFDSGDTIAARYFARQLFDKPVKVHSPAIDEIKYELNKILATGIPDQKGRERPKPSAHKKGEGVNI